MKTKLAVLLLAGGLLLPPVASATDPSPELAKVIEQIEARRAAKAEAKPTIPMPMRVGPGGWDGAVYRSQSGDVRIEAPGGPGRATINVKQ